jgi:hypothetical protein
MIVAGLFAASAVSGQATHFAVSAPATATAGTSFSVTVTALDVSGSVDKSYKSNHNVTVAAVPLTSPNGTSADVPSAAFFDQGVATISVTLYKAATTTLTVTDSDNTGITGTSASFTVNAAAAASLAFTQSPPTWVKASSTFSAKVAVTDAYGNPVPNQLVSVTLNKNTSELGCPTLAGPCTATTGDGTGGTTLGEAFFDNTLSVSQDTVGYRLAATAGDATGNSDFFNVGDDYGQFGNGNGPRGQDNPGTTLTATSVNGVNNNNLALTVDGGIPVRLDLCGGLQDAVGSGTVFEAVKTSTGGALTPTWTLTITVKKAGLVTPSRGAATYDMCLGTRNIWVASGGATGTNDCVPNSSATSNSTSLKWLAKGGVCAVPDDPDHLDTAVYWGNVPNAGDKGTNTPANIKDCSQARTPVVMSKNKTGPGDLVFKLCVPFPWDGAGGFH